MAQQRKLQIFVSSTFTDLVDERQAAVEAILTAGHIPAGMELFTAGNEEQMNVIYRWIDESDAYMLLIGGRYGSVEPTTNKSYTQLEYEYAISSNKPSFALVLHDDFIDDKVRQQTRQVVLESVNTRELESLKMSVKKNMVKFPKNIDQVKLFTRESISEIERKPNLTGWIRATDANQDVAEQLAHLIKENAEIRNKLNVATTDFSNYGGLNSDQTTTLLNQYNTEPFFTTEGLELVANIKKYFNGQYSHPTAIDYLWIWYLVIPKSELFASVDQEAYLLNELEDLELIEKVDQVFGSKPNFKISKIGLAFCLKIKVSVDMINLQPIVGEFIANQHDLFI